MTEPVNAVVKWTALQDGAAAIIPPNVPAVAIIFGQPTDDELGTTHVVLAGGLGSDSDILTPLAEVLHALGDSATRSAETYAATHAEWVESPEYLMARLEGGYTLTED
jgi:hypothetical protein